MTDNKALAALTQARAYLAKARTVDEFLAVMHHAELARTYVRQMELGLESANEATAIHLHAAAGLAAAIDEGQDNGTIAKPGGNRQKSIIDTFDNAPRLSDLGVDADTVRHARLIELAANTQGIDNLRAQADAEERQLTKAEVIKIGRAIESGIKPGEKDDWYTPKWIFDALDVVFDMDVCAPALESSRTCPAKTYYTESDDGLAQPWDGLIWCNPPYSNAGPWVAKWLDHGDGVLLAHIPANAAWSVDLWRRADLGVWLQAVPFSRPNGQTYRPGYALQLMAIGDEACTAVARCGELTAKTGAVWRRL